MVEGHPSIPDAPPGQGGETGDIDPRLLHVQKLGSLGILAGSIAHDLNNSLMAVLANLDVARTVPHKTAAALEHALHATHCAMDLTRQMLSLSSPGTAAAAPVDLAAVVRQNLAMMRASIPRCIDIHVDFAEETFGIEANAGKIQQVLMNLINNASDAIGNRRGTIRISAGTDGQAEESLPNGRIWMEIEDDGCGMDESTLERMFDPFHTTKPNGMGLGMSAVRTILREFGGEIEVRSRQGSGTRIRLRFPRVVVPPSAQELPRTETVRIADAMRNRRLLLVEDDHLVRQALASILGRGGHAFFVVPNGAEALKLVESGQWSFRGAIVDLTLPDGMDGIELMGRIRRASTDMFVLLISGFDRHHAMERAKGSPPDGFLQKPFRSGALVEELQRLDALAARRVHDRDDVSPAVVPPPGDPLRPAP